MIWIGNNLKTQVATNTNGEAVYLYNHGWGPTSDGKGKKNGQYWLRGIGWYAAALADTISMLPNTVDYKDKRDQLLDIEKQLFNGMMYYQDDDAKNGTWMWRNIVNLGGDITNKDTGNSNIFETSGTSLMAYAMMKAYVDEHAGIDATHGEAGLKAFNGMFAQKQIVQWTLKSVYKQSGVETVDTEYLKYDFVENEAKGVGPLMMAAAYANDAAKKLNSKQDITESVVTMEGYVYDTNPSEPSVTENPGEATVTYYYNTENSNENGTVWENPSLNAGDYYMYAVIDESDKYNGYTTGPH